MPLFEFTDSAIQPVPVTPFAEQQLLERQDLQRLLLQNIEAIDRDLFVIAEEYSEFEGSKRRIDILAIDSARNVVVVELKRTDDGGHMDLQAIRYAAMVASLTLANLVRARCDYLTKKHGAADESHVRNAILEFLEHTADEDPVFTTRPRIVLVAARFSREITTTVLWLNAQGLDIRAITMTPYKIGSKTIVDVSQVLPLALEREYQVQIKKKEMAAADADSTGSRRERTLDILVRSGRVVPGTLIELIHEFRPENASDLTAHPEGTFTATIADPSQRRGVRWRDGNLYSLTSLTKLLSDKHDVGFVTNIYRLWHIIGAKESMSIEANELIQNQGE